MHSHPLRKNHVNDPKSLIQLSYGRKSVEQSQEDIHEIPKIRLNLFAVICISVSHYVAFVRCGSSNDSDWCFFDSMSDRDSKSS